MSYNHIQKMKILKCENLHSQQDEGGGNPSDEEKVSLKVKERMFTTDRKTAGGF